MKSSKPLIGIDIQSIQNASGGLGTYVRSLIAHLPQSPGSNKFAFNYLGQHQKISHTLGRILWENWTLPRQAQGLRLDLLHVPAFAAPIIKPCKVILTVHDLIGMTFPNQKGLPSKCYWGKWLPSTISRADHIIAASHYTKNEIIRLLDIKPEKIDVIYLSGQETYAAAIDETQAEKTLQKLKIHDSFLLCVGSAEPRKNLERTIKAFQTFKKSRPKQSVQLVITGPASFAGGSYAQELQKQAESQKDIIFTGFVTGEELHILYKKALTFLFPSLAEGFGLPVLEAMGAGIPVITSDQTSLPELAGSAAKIVKPYDIESIARAMAEFVDSEEERKRFITKGYEQIKQFSWKKMADDTLKIYEKVLSS